MDLIFHFWYKQISYFGEQNIKFFQKILISMRKSNNTHIYKKCILEITKKKLYNKLSIYKKYLLEFIHIIITGHFSVVGYNEY